MSNENEIFNIATDALIQGNRTHPQGGHGTTRDQHSLSREDAAHHARVVIDALKNAGYEIKKATPHA